MNSLPFLSWHENANRNEYGTQVDIQVARNDTLQVVLTLKLFDINAHEIALPYDDAGNLILRVNGQRTYGMFASTLDDIKNNHLEIASLTINRNGQEISLPIDDIKNYFNPYLGVRIGLKGELYIVIHGGDAGEKYAVSLTIVNGVIRYVTPLH
jgi:hypothetical protein